MVRHTISSGVFCTVQPYSGLWFAHRAKELDEGRGLAAVYREWTGGADGGVTSARSRVAQQFFYGGVSATCVNVGGAPLMVERLGRADLAGVNREGPALLQLLLLSYVVYLETTLRMLTAESLKQERLVRTNCLTDASGAGMSTMWNINVVKEVASIGPAFYPEMTERVFILQSPWLMAKIFGAISPLLPEDTRGEHQGG